MVDPLAPLKAVPTIEGAYKSDVVLIAASSDALWARALAIRLIRAGIQSVVRECPLAEAMEEGRHVLIFSQDVALADAPPDLTAFVSFTGVGRDRERAGRLLIPMLTGAEGRDPRLSEFESLDLRVDRVVESLVPRLKRVFCRAMMPEPAYQTRALRTLGQSLEETQNRLDSFKEMGGNDEDTLIQLNERLRLIRGEMREGGDIVEGFILSGRYRLLERIGVGGFGTVWKGWDRSHCGIVAIKILHTQHNYSASRITRFFRGSRAMSGLSHPSIVGVRTPEAIDGGYRYFVMDYVDGSSFQDLILKGLLGFEAICRVIVDVAKALEHAHQSGIVHRDVKPSNILVGAGGEVHLTDFDLVWAVDGEQALTTGALGTFVYAAPEQLKVGEPVSKSRDVYSLAMTAIFALHGSLLAPAILFEREEFVDGLCCATELKEVLKRAVDLDCTQRYGSMAMFSQALEDAWAV